ncbi:hypothetical protein ASE01_00575 [Nocardioides sp. Root190]|uniref:universal stress protein n=1 Tax=Nocardioides sp. Root190 TaxID=1736488 RepID=UPI0006F8A070|nr:universal stress protein [Nocardioides sp. Root190]KRB80039.1 hypothetical protein ASE01_00575 [Nocardioides sp. Root190]
MAQHIPSGSIVVAADGSKHADRALCWAATQASLEHRPLVVLTAAEGNAQRINHEAAQRASSLVTPGTDVVGLVAADDPRAALVDLSTEARLLVMGSRGRGAVRSLVLGSVSAAVCKLASCPVVVCRPHEDHAGLGVLVGVDGTRESLPIIEFAFAFASLNQLPLTVVHCVWDVIAAVAGLRNVSVNDVDLGAGDEAHVLLAETLAGFGEKYPDVPTTLRVTHGLVDDVLGGRSSAWDLVVVGRHPPDTVNRLVTGSIAVAVVERAHTTAAVVPVPVGGTPR